MSELLAHPLIKVLVPLLLSGIGTVLSAFVVHYIKQREKLREAEMSALLTRLSTLESSQREQSQKQEAQRRAILSLEIMQQNTQKSLLQTQESVRELTGAVQQLMVQLPTIYVTKQDMDRLEDGLYDRLERIAEAVSDKPSRGELDKKADRSEVAALAQRINARK